MVWPTPVSIFSLFGDDWNLRFCATISVVALFICYFYKGEKKMKKLLAFAALIFALACLLASCNGQGGKDDNATHTHSFDEWEIIKNPTCSENGEKSRYCDCGERQTETIVAKGHTEVIDAAVEATCKKTGLTEGKHCSVCGEVLVEQTIVDALGHDYDGNGTCTRCGKGEASSIQAGLYNANDNLVASWDTLVNTYGMDVSKDYIVSIPYTTTSLPAYILTNKSELSGGCKLVIDNSITTIGDYAFASCDSLTSITIPDSITSIGEWAFASCTSLTSITIPDSVTSIGELAFSGCESLAFNEYDNAYYLGNESNPYYALIKSKTSDISSCIIHDDTVLIAYHAFVGCDSLTSITIPNSVTNIGEMAFCCTNLKRITVDENNKKYKSIDGNLYTKDGKTLVQYAIGKNDTIFAIPNSVTSIGNYAFVGCDSLTSITIPDSVTSVGDSAFLSCTSLTSITIPDSVTSIGTEALSCCTSLTSVMIGNSVTSVGEMTFYGCNSLTSITIPDSVTSIGNSAFSSCTSLTSVMIGNSVTSIGNRAFSGCNSLTSITIPDGVTSIGDSAFNNCGLTSITIPDSVTSIGAEAFRYCTSLTSITVDENNSKYKSIDGNLYTKDGKTLVQYAIGKADTSFVVPDSVTSIGNCAFYGCTSLTTITIPDSVTSIGDYAFYGCTSLTTITIPDSVTSIGDYAFSSCTSLTSITIPDSVTSIGDRAFYNCRSLTSITIPDSVTSIGDYAFYRCYSLTSITIPDSVTSIGDSAFAYCGSLTIYCEAASQPSGWDSKWNYSNRPVVWGYTGE